MSIKTLLIKHCHGRLQNTAHRRLQNFIYIGKLNSSLSLSASCSSANATQPCLPHVQYCATIFIIYFYFSHSTAAPRHLCLLHSHPSSRLGALWAVTELPHPAPLGSFIRITNFLDCKVFHTCSVCTQSCRNARSEGSVGKTDGTQVRPQYDAAHICKAAKSCVCFNVVLASPPRRQWELMGRHTEFSPNNLRVLMSRPSKSQDFQ